MDKIKDSVTLTDKQNVFIEHLLGCNSSVLGDTSKAERSVTFQKDKLVVSVETPCDGYHSVCTIVLTDSQFIGFNIFFVTNNKPQNHE